MYKIALSKDLIPYKEEIIINDELFYLAYNYNLYDSRIYIDLYNKNNELVAEQEPIVLGNTLWQKYLYDESARVNKKFPKALIIPQYKDMQNKKNITFDNINEVELYIQELKDV